MTTARICRFILPTNPLLTLTISLTFFNYLLFVTFSDVSNVFCVKDDRPSHEAKRERRDDKPEKYSSIHWKIKDENQYWLVEMAKYSTFNWETEMERMFDLIPVLEMRTDTKFSADTDDQVSSPPHSLSQWGQNLSKSVPLALVTEKSTLLPIANEVRKINENIANIYNKHTNFIEKPLLDYLTEKIMFHGILRCEDVSKLESSTSYPKIKYTFRSMTKWTGHLRISVAKSIPIKLRRFQKKNYPPKSDVEKMNYPMLARKNQVPYLDKTFERAKLEVLNLLRMQGWYGVPRLIGVCISSSDGDDILDHYLKGKDGVSGKIPSAVKYLVSRHDEGTAQLCESHYASFQCERLHSVMRLVNLSDRPALAALKIMKNTAYFFNQFWSRGAVLYDLIGTDFIINSNYDVMLSDVSSVKFLAGNEYSENSSIQRLLSETICKEDSECATVSWQTNSISYKFGLHCDEVRGFCSNGNRCWGIDANVHACVLSRWLFVKLHSTIPTSWSRDEDLTNLLQCASKSSPAERCNWKQLMVGLKELYKFAQNEEIAT